MRFPLYNLEVLQGNHIIKGKTFFSPVSIDFFKTGNWCWDFPPVVNIRWHQDSRGLRKVFCTKEKIWESLEVRKSEKSSQEGTGRRTQIGDSRGNRAICEVTSHHDTYIYWNLCGWWKWVSVDIYQGAETQDEETEQTEGGSAHKATWLSPILEVQNPVEGQQAH